MSHATPSAGRSVSNPFQSASSGLKHVLGRREVQAALLLIMIVLLVIYPHWEKDSARLDISAEAEVYVLLALGLNIVVGYAGLLDLGYAAFFAIGAYTLALLGSAHFAVTSHSFSSPFLSFGPGGIHVNIFVMIPVSALVAAICGALFGAPTLRLRGDYLAIVTLGFGEIVPKVIQNLGQDNSLGLPNITNGVNTITGIDRPPDFHLFGLNASFQGNDETALYYLGLIVIVLSIFMILSLRNSRLGRAWAAIREDEIAAAHMGINITRTRLLAFGLGAAFSGFGGLLYATRVESVDYTQFGFNVSITILVMVILGGIGSIPGAILGGIVMTYLNDSWLLLLNGKITALGGVLMGGPGPVGSVGSWMNGLNLTTAKPLFFGIILVGMMLLRPQGLWPSATRARELHPQTAGERAEEDADLFATRSEV